MKASNSFPERPPRFSYQQTPMVKHMMKDVSHTPPPEFRDPIRHAMPGQQQMPIPSERAAMGVMNRMQGEPGQDQVRQVIRQKFPLLPEPAIRPTAPLNIAGGSGNSFTARKDARFRYSGAYEPTSQDLRGHEDRR